MSLNDFNYSESIENACHKIAPSWSLENMVAVNPYMGLSNKSFASASNAYKKMADIDLLMPRAFYIEAIEANKITDKDLLKALIKNDHSDITVEEFKDMLNSPKAKSETSYKVKTLADTVSDVTKTNWSGFALDRFSNWATSFFDQGQAFWKTARHDKDLYLAWKLDAGADRSTDIMKLKGFRALIKEAPSNSEEAISNAIEILGLNSTNIDTYLHTLLLRFGGWASYITGLDWDENLYGGSKDNLKSFIAILLTWEASLLKTCIKTEPSLEIEWKNNRRNIGASENMKQFDRDLAVNLILQDALDFSRESELIDQFKKSQTAPKKKARPLAQAIFCIDVRSEIYRRNLEHVNNSIETIGFAGFFGFPINHKSIGNEEGVNQCPALIPSGPVVHENIHGTTNQREIGTKRIDKFQVNKFWKRFKTGAVSGFSFVSPMGLYYMFKLITDSFGLTRPVVNPKHMGLSKKQIAFKGVDLSEISIEDQVSMAKGALTGMGLTNNFAPLVLITGHGSDTVNNPHATGLDCGACGGHAGDVNAMTAEAVLNSLEVRKQLVSSGIIIPDDTHFTAALHNTTTDEILLLSEHLVPDSHVSYLIEIKANLEIASSAARNERAERFEIKNPNKKEEAILAKSKDWSTVRPEWGLAGCSAFIIAPRERTSNISLEGQSFLHNYTWKNDKDFSVLESIMTAPMVVTSWINLQYFASTVDNKNFGSGNKTLHNVTGGFGVLEGGAGDLRVGLAMQSVHDGHSFQHTPYRLNVVIEAPTEAINKILKKHPNVKALFDNDWVRLMTINESGKIDQRYSKNLSWDQLEKIGEIKSKVFEKELDIVEI